jgi:hypothetical protein
MSASMSAQSPKEFPCVPGRIDRDSELDGSTDCPFGPNWTANSTVTK